MAAISSSNPRAGSQSLPIVASAPGKSILFGEHAVVYGKTAIATAVNLRSYVLIADPDAVPSVPKRDGITLWMPDIGHCVHLPCDKLKAIYSSRAVAAKEQGDEYPALCDEVRAELLPLIAPECKNEMQRIATLSSLHLLAHIAGPDSLSPMVIVHRSQIPLGSGLGSSASLAVALSTALLKYCGRLKSGEQGLNQINAWALVAEKVIHGTPSGIDNTVVTYGGALAFSRGSSMQPLPGCSAFEFLLTNTNVPKNTKEQVGKVRARLDMMPGVVNPILDAIQNVCDLARARLTGHATEASTAAAHAGLPPLADLVQVNQSLLTALNVSHPAIDAVVRVSQEHGYAAKLTGAGGGGCVLTYIHEPSNAEALQRAINALGYECFRTQVGTIGARVHLCQGTDTDQLVKGLVSADSPSLAAIAGSSQAI